MPELTPLSFDKLKSEVPAVVIGQTKLLSASLSKLMPENKLGTYCL